ncbi:MAG: sulfurtransferase TusA family protein [Dehalococcoidia bacterium]|nr:sulfurtransferase TusA family protein [Dehalococcoidia bacterium]
MTIENTKVNLELDLRGEVCPYTFVKSKLAIEDMEIGEVLQVILDHMEAVDNVPKSMTNEGQQVLGVDQINETDWAVTILKQKD